MRSTSYFALGAAALLGCGEGLEIPVPRTEDHSVLLWSGSDPNPPPCPRGRLDYWDGWADVSASPQEECGTCSCGPARCVLPSEFVAHEAALCADEGISVKFDTATYQRGECIKADPLVPDEELASITLNPPAVAHRCEPSQQLTPPPLIGIFARACPWVEGDFADFGGLTCIAPDPDGSCPPGFSGRFEFQERISDARTCTPCTCGDPSGGRCLADVLLFRDTGCSDLITLSNGVETPACIDTQPNWSLAAARVILAHEEPGACSPTVTTSRVEGTIESGETRVFCCTERRVINDD
ncbi:hypothetical protein SOCE836_084370 [Sorangium cellulosum]|uniref:Uncharacterized protein n=1 Tax=Sorangium cellulosum TaxID=56 RepID=A0A4P2R007_SORCE|nr:hypothetical protein SOCE836_084370 [Sorangium cellulosum]WCQ95532.1 hypothetical protein NQZ70_08309 [Sorangium sp. Soce836]